MNVHFTRNQEDYLRGLVESGEYGNISEAVREAIRLLKQKEQEDALKLQHLRALIEEGDAQLENGDYVDYAAGQGDRILRDAGW